MSNKVFRNIPAKMIEPGMTIRYGFDYFVESVHTDFANINVRLTGMALPMSLSPDARIDVISEVLDTEHEVARLVSLADQATTRAGIEMSIAADYRDRARELLSSF